MAARLDIRFFISSPGDVSDERGLARRVLKRLGQEFGLRDRIHIEEVSWDDPGAPVPMDAHLTPQHAINNRRPKPSDCDVVAVILWSRMGTPLPAEYRKPDGNPFVSGTEWEFLDALEGAKRNGGKPSVLLYRRNEEPRVGLDDPGHDEKTRQYKAVKAFFSEFKNADGSLNMSYQTYDSPSDFERLLERELRELIQVRLEALPKSQPTAVTPVPQPEIPSTPAWQGNPYRGLKPFREEHAAIFFGRGRETDELVKRFADPATRLVAVAGASGSGKSSLVGAGLLPRLRNGAFPGSADWLSVRFTPAERGSDPFLNLTRRLAPLYDDASDSPETMADTLRAKPEAIKALVAKLLQGKPAKAALLLFIDQFEELFTARVDDSYREPFIALIDAAGRSDCLRLVLTLRSDYYEHCARDERLASWLRQGSFPLAAPNALALAEMIQYPARLAGLEPGPGLVEAILKDAGNDPGALALVEFALAELYDRGGGKHITVEAYRSLGGKDGDGNEVGGIGGVIQSQAEKAVQDATGKVDEAALAKIFPRLADVDEQGGAVRKRARLDAFGDAERALVNRLVDERLLLTNKDDANLPWWKSPMRRCCVTGRGWPSG
jgi:hypothetical protein